MHSDLNRYNNQTNAPMLEKGKKICQRLETMHALLSLLSLYQPSPNVIICEHSSSLSRPFLMVLVIASILSNANMSKW